MSKKILVISYNKFPTIDDPIAEGTGLRYWRIAMALKHFGHKVDMAILDQNKPDMDNYSGIKIKSFNFNYKDLKKLLKDYQVIIFSYAFGELSKNIIDSSPASSILIADAISPYYVEALTKSGSSKEDKEILNNYYGFLDYCNYSLANSDYIIVGNDIQKQLYLGVLASTGRLVDGFNTDRIVEVPAYPELIDGSTTRISDNTNDDGRINILWFGGMYPWFNPNKLIDIFSDPKVKKIAKLTVVGAGNPFYPISNKRFNGSFYSFKNQSDENDLTDKNIFFKDWVDYYQRIDIFNSSDFAISINADNLENKYSFRIRIADMICNGLPVVTNGGDAVGEDFINQGYAFRFNFDSDNIGYDFIEFLNHNIESIKEARKKLLQKDILFQHSSIIAARELSRLLSNPSKLEVKEKGKRLRPNNAFDMQDQIHIKNEEIYALNNKIESLGMDIKTKDDLINQLNINNNLVKNELEIIYKKPHIYLYKKIKKLREKLNIRG